MIRITKIKTDGGTTVTTREMIGKGVSPLSTVDWDDARAFIGGGTLPNPASEQVLLKRVDPAGRHQGDCGDHWVAQHQYGQRSQAVEHIMRCDR